MPDLTTPSRARKAPSLKDRIRLKIARSKAAVFLPRELVRDLRVGEDQVLRAMRELTRDRVLTKLGKGVYAKLEDDPFNPGKRQLAVGFADAARQTLDKLGVEYAESRVVKAYNSGATTQVQSNAVLAVKGRFSRRLSYNGMELVCERA
jgi:hypothetical protein